MPLSSAHSAFSHLYVAAQVGAPVVLPDDEIAGIVTRFASYGLNAVDPSEPPGVPQKTP